MVKKILLLCFVFIGFGLQALSLDQILRANDAKSLRSYVKKWERENFLRILCQKQKENKKPPVACYELGLNVDTWCLSLTWENLNLTILTQALRSKFLSSSCRKYLKKKQRILLYRKKDLLLPELKNYWTKQEIFL